MNSLLEWRIFIFFLYLFFKTLRRDQSAFYTSLSTSFLKPTKNFLFKPFLSTCRIFIINSCELDTSPLVVYSRVIVPPQFQADVTRACPHRASTMERHRSSAFCTGCAFPVRPVCEHLITLFIRFSTEFRCL